MGVDRGAGASNPGWSWSGGGTGSAPASTKTTGDSGANYYYSGDSGDGGGGGGGGVLQSMVYTPEIATDANDEAERQRELLREELRQTTVRPASWLGEPTAAVRNLQNFYQGYVPQNVDFPLSERANAVSNQMRTVWFDPNSPANIGNPLLKNGPVVDYPRFYSPGDVLPVSNRWADTGLYTPNKNTGVPEKAQGPSQTVQYLYDTMPAADRTKMLQDAGYVDASGKLIKEITPNDFAGLFQETVRQKYYYGSQPYALKAGSTLPTTNKPPATYKKPFASSSGGRRGGGGRGGSGGGGGGEGTRAANNFLMNLIKWTIG